MKKFVLTSLTALALSLAAEGAAFACRCFVPAGKLTPEQVRAALVKDFNEAFAVFTGEVVGGDIFKVKFKVDKIWKGGLGGEIVMKTGAIDEGGGRYSISSCDYSFKRGEKYLVFAYGDTAAEMKARECTRTKELERAWQEIENLDEVWPHERRNRKPEGQD